MNFESGSFEPINFFPKIFFTGSFSGSGPEIHRFVRILEDVWVGATNSCYQLSLFINGSPWKRFLDFKIQKKTQLLKWMFEKKFLIYDLKYFFITIHIGCDAFEIAVVTSRPRYSLELNTTIIRSIMINSKRIISEYTKIFFRILVFSLKNLFNKK